MPLLAGPAALQLRIPSLNRKPKDVDYITTTLDSSSYPGDVFVHPLLDSWVLDYTYGWNRVVTLNELYTLKVSHSYWAVSYTHLRAHETGRNLVCRLLLE